MNCSTRRFAGVLLASVFFSGAATAIAQRSFNLSIALTNQNGVAISWPVQSATPPGDTVLVPQFRVERSSDLKTWTPVSEMLTGALHQRVNFVDSLSGAEFYRVESVIAEPYAQLSRARLDFGELSAADFFGAEFFAASLQEATLDGAVFAAANVQQADFTGADLSNADLFAAVAVLAKFDFATLAQADCSFGGFEAASFSSADLTGVDFSFATLSGANFDFAMFKGVKLNANTLIDAKPKLVWQIVNSGATNAILTNMDLSFADFTGANISGAKLNNSDFSASFLDNCDLREADFSNANLRFVSFEGTLMDSTTVIEPKSRLVWQILNQDFAAGRDLHGTNLAFVFLAGANFSDVNLSDADCTLTICFGANFGGANLSRANCTQVDFFKAGLTNANLTEVNFNFADLSQASLRGSITNGATFVGTTFDNTIMPDGTIRNF